MSTSLGESQSSHDNHPVNESGSDGGKSAYLGDGTEPSAGRATLSFKESDFHTKKQGRQETSQQGGAHRRDRHESWEQS